LPANANAQKHIPSPTSQPELAATEGAAITTACKPSWKTIPKGLNFLFTYTFRPSRMLTTFNGGSSQNGASGNVNAIARPAFWNSIRLWPASFDIAMSHFSGGYELPLAETLHTTLADS
jgi:hypothetical protein